MTSASSLRFKVDNNLPSEVAQRLRDAGHEADTAMDEGLGAARDSELAAACRRERRALVSLDTDFADIRTYPPAEFHGVIVLRLRVQSKPRVLEAVARVVPWLERERLGGTLWIVDETSIRIRGVGT